MITDRQRAQVAIGDAAQNKALRNCLMTERAAIHEFDGNMSREQAQELTRQEFARGLPDLWR